MRHDREQDAHARLIAALQDPRVYDHPVDRIEVIETHISHVLLTGSFAYKIKKPLNLGFLDFGTLAQRGHFCREELRLNRRTAPELYLEVVPITGTPAHPQLRGRGAVIEYAVKMRQFPQQSLADRMMAQGRLAERHMDEIAVALADFHGRIEGAAADATFGTPEQVRQPVRDNFDTLHGLLSDPGDLERLAALRRWSQRVFGSLHRTLAARRRDGFVRECHGDMHLGNLAFLDHRVVAFDCIEFDPGLRWIDVMSEAAFLAMDIEARGRRDYAWRFVNAYLAQTGDYAGMAVLTYYKAYRAMVRAKVARIRLTQSGPRDDRRRALQGDYQGYIDLAQGYTAPVHPWLGITRGLSGSGKSTVASVLTSALGAIQLRSDIERKRLFGLTGPARSQSQLHQGLYSGEASERTYARLAELAETVLRSGYAVIVDAAFLQRGRRARFRRMAAALGIPFIILETVAPPSVLRSRVAARLAAGRDASEADGAVLDSQLASHEPLDPDERACTVIVDTAQTLPLTDVLHRVEALVCGPAPSPSRGGG